MPECGDVYVIIDRWRSTHGWRVYVTDDVDGSFDTVSVRRIYKRGRLSKKVYEMDWNEGDFIRLHAELRVIIRRK